MKMSEVTVVDVIMFLFGGIGATALGWLGNWLFKKKRADSIKQMDNTVSGSMAAGHIAKGKKSKTSAELSQSVVQKGNKVGGDLAGGNIHNTTDK